MYNQSQIPDPTLEALLRGIERDDGSIADLVCDKRDVDALSGKIPVLPSTATLPRGDDDDGIAEGAEMRTIDDEYSEVSYNCLRYAAASTVRNGILASLNNTTGVDHLEVILKRIRDEAHRSIDNKLNDVLTSTSLNTEADVTSGSYSGAEWDDGGSSSQPLQDIDLGLETVPGADTLFLGREIARDLRAHPDFIAETSQFSAGQLGQSQLATFLSGKFNDLNVVIGNRFYGNDANEGQTLSTGFDLSGVAWLGYKRDLVMTEFVDESPVADQQRDAKRSAVVVTYERRIDIVRPHSEMGLIFTNITS
jgi:hypothetical protein